MGLAGFDQALSQVPDDWTIRVSVNEPMRPANAVFTFAFGGGVVTGVTGRFTSPSPACNVLLTFQDAPLSALTSPYPVLDVMSSFSDMTSAVSGTTAFDGTSTAEIEAQLGGGSMTNYLFDVDIPTGDVTALP
jgi:hypothetical protein